MICYDDEWPLCQGLAGLPECILWLFKVRQDQIHIIILCFLELFIKPWLSCCVKVSGKMTHTGFTLQLGEICLSLPRGISGYQKTYSGGRGDNQQWFDEPTRRSSNAPINALKTGNFNGWVSQSHMQALPFKVWSVKKNASRAIMWHLTNTWHTWKTIIHEKGQDSVSRLGWE